MSWNFLGTAILLLSLGQAAPSWALTGREILKKVDDLWRGTSSAALVEMHIKTENYERTLEIKAYSRGTEDTLLRIVLPKKEAGTATLKSGENIWNYLPKTRRVIKVPSSMMMTNWMGSHFTNDDLVKDSRMSDDYNFSISFEGERGGKKVYELVLTPNPEAAVVWGKVVVEVLQDPLVPVWQEYYDEKGNLVRRAAFDTVQTLSGRIVPTHFTMTPMDKPGEFTEITYKELLFDLSFGNDFFSIENLKRN